MGLAILSKIHARDRTEFNTQRLEEDGKDVRHEYDEEEFELETGAGGNVGCIVSCGLVSVLCHKF